MSDLIRALGAVGKMPLYNNPVGLDGEMMPKAPATPAPVPPQAGGFPMTPQHIPMTLPEEEPAPIQFTPKGKVPMANPFNPSQVQMVDEQKKLTNAQKAIRQKALAQQAARRR